MPPSLPPMLEQTPDGMEVEKIEIDAALSHPPPPQQPIQPKAEKRKIQIPVLMEVREDEITPALSKAPSQRALPQPACSHGI